jgi:hypothetical protein
MRCVTPLDDGLLAQARVGSPGCAVKATEREGGRDYSGEHANATASGGSDSFKLLETEIVVNFPNSSKE